MFLASLVTFILLTGDGTDGYKSNAVLSHYAHGRHYLITAAHNYTLFDGPYHISVQTEFGSCPAVVDVTFKKEDMGIISVDESCIDISTYYRGADLGGMNPGEVKVGDKMIVSARVWSKTTSYIKHLKGNQIKIIKPCELDEITVTKCIEVNKPVKQGMSGAGCWSGPNLLAGIVVGYDGDNGYCTPFKGSKTDKWIKKHLRTSIKRYINERSKRI